jgi:hypothetical protein
MADFFTRVFYSKGTESRAQASQLGLTFYNLNKFRLATRQHPHDIQPCR